MFVETPGIGTSPSILKTRCWPSGAQSCLAAMSKLNGVTWNTLVPSTLDVKRAAPVGSPLKPTKLSFFPSGETVGSAQHGPMRRRSFPLRSILQNASSLATGSKRWNMILIPSGVKVGSSSQTFGAGNSIEPLPSAFMIATLLQAPGASCSKTIWRPSGDQAGQRHRR